MGEGPCAIAAAAKLSRARIILLSADGKSNTDIAGRLGLSKPTVGVWRMRYVTLRIVGLYDEPRPGGPRSIRDEQVATLLRKALKTKPKYGTHWWCRSIAAETKLPESTVQRVWEALGLQPHRQIRFKISTDTFFVERVRDIVGLYLNSSDHAVVLYVDGRGQIQALDRAAPLLPFGLGYVEGVTHDYVRHGTTTLFTALHIATGRVLTKRKQHHRNQEFLQCLRHIEASVPKKLDVHLIVDNYATCKHESARRWLAARPSFHIHCTPTYLSWVNQVEVWFNIITQRAIRRGTFGSVRDLTQRIEAFVTHWNRKCQPFAWTATSNSILEKLEGLSKAIAGTGHQTSIGAPLALPGRHPVATCSARSRISLLCLFRSSSVRDDGVLAPGTRPNPRGQRHRVGLAACICRSSLLTGGAHTRRRGVIRGVVG